MATLEVDHLSAEFRLTSGTIHAIRDVSFTLDQGETLAIVGESGSGKTATAMSTIRLNPEPPCVYTGGEIRYKGRDVLRLNGDELRAIRGSGISMIFQDPTTSLNPVKTIGNQVVEVAKRAEHLTRSEAKQRAIQALRDVGIPNAEERAGQYPHQFSGGMRQRAMIAMALAAKPSILIADEPTTALDVTIQAQIMELLLDLRTRFHMGILLITHDLALVSEFADKVLVMYAGAPVEHARTDELFRAPMMPYSMLLLNSAPRIDRPRTRIGVRIPGSPPDMHELPAGCAFGPRCFLRTEACERGIPPFTEKRPGHDVACIRSTSELTAASHTVGRTENEMTT